MWAGTELADLVRLDPETGEQVCFRARREAEGALPDDLVTALLEDRSGNLWVGTWGGLSMQPIRKAFWTIPLAKDEVLPRGQGRGGPARIGSIYVPPHGTDTIWVRTLDDGLARLSLSPSAGGPPTPPA